MLDYKELKDIFNLKDFIAFFNVGEYDKYQWLVDIVSDFCDNVDYQTIKNYVTGERSPNTNRPESLKSKLSEVTPSILSEYPNTNIDTNSVNILYKFLIDEKEASFAKQLLDILVLLASKNKYHHVRDVHLSAESTSELRNYVNSICNKNINLPLSSQLASSEEFAKIYFKKIKTIGRFKKYWSKEEDSQNHYIEGIDVSLKTSDQKSVPFEKVLFPSELNIDKENSSISLRGKGGIGKTFLILRTMENIFSDNKYIKIIPFYIELQLVSSDYNGNVHNALLSEIQKYYDAIDEVTFNSFLKENAHKVIIFADGMNEVTGDAERSALAKSITDMSKIYGCRFCVSSRQNHVGMFNRLAGISGNFKDAEVNKLEVKQIEKILSVLNTRYDELSKETQNLLETPQGLSMYYELRKNSNSGFSEFKTLGDLILAYSDLLLGINRNEISDNSDLDFEKTLEKIAYVWVRDSCFKGIVESNQFKDSFKSLEAPQEQFITDNEIIGLTSNNKIKSIFPRIKDNFYEFSHQNFRDMYCARFLARQIKRIDETNIKSIFDDFFNLKKSQVSNNNEIIELLSSFVVIDTYEYDKKAISTLRLVAQEGTSLTNYDYPLSRLIKIYAYRNNDNISGLDLSSLDLREITVSGYKIYSDNNKDVFTKFDNSKINASTFLKTGLDTASSTIAKYQYNGKTYIVAFAKTSIAVIDVVENQVQLIRNLPSNDWVNCCYVAEKAGNPIIYLGHENGTLSEFDPRLLYTDPCNVKQDLMTENMGEIFSVIGINISGEEYIAFSSVKEKHAFVSAWKKNQVGEDKFIKIELPKIHNLEKYKLEDVSCRLGYSEKSGILFASYVDKIFAFICDEHFKYRNPIEIKLYKDDEYTIPYISSHHSLWDTCLDETTENDATKGSVEMNIKQLYNCDFIEEDYCVCRLFLNQGNSIDLFELIIDLEAIDEVSEFKANHLHTYKPAGNISGITYTKFSKIDYPRGDCSNWATHVLVGVKCKEDNSSIDRFYELYCSDDLGEEANFYSQSVGNTYDGFATWTGVYYQQNDKTFLATVSDHRTIEIDALADEEYPRKIYEGAYNGVHYIDTSSNEQKFICGNYDGCIVEVQSKTHKIKKTINWNVNNTVQLHTNWVWKTVYLTDNCFISCGYDGRCISTYINENKRTIDIKCLIEVNEKLLDFCVSKNYNKIYVISEKGWLYTVQYKTNDDGSVIYTSEYKKDKIINEDNIKLRTITINENEDTPVLFYNIGGNQGHIKKYTVSADLSSTQEFVDIQGDKFTTDIENNGQKLKKHLYVRHMRFVKLDKFDEDLHCLIAVGDLHKSGHVVISGYGKDTAGTLDKTRMNVHCSISIGGQINDFTVTEHEDGYVLWLAHKDSKISALKLTYEDELIKVKNFILKEEIVFNTEAEDGSKHDNVGDFEKSVVVKTADQPMCLKSYKGSVLIGLLNGEVYQASLILDKEICKKEYSCQRKYVIHLKSIIKTHADLHSVSNVQLRNCEIDDKKKFEEQLNGYFKIKNG